MSERVQMIIPVALYLIVCMYFAIQSGRRQMQSTAITDERKRFSGNYFAAGRSLGGFVLAMSITSTYFDASSYFGGPGIAYSRGLSWVYLAMIQLPLTFLILGTYGKKMGMVSRKINAATIPDYLRHRYQSEALVRIASLSMIIFFITMMISQMMGGAILFQTMTGVPYTICLVIFGCVVIVYTALGGFKAVATGGAVQGVVMLGGACVLLAAVIHYGGGMESIKEQLDAVMPYWSEATAGGNQSVLYTSCFWMLVGYAAVGLPHTAVRNMSFRDTKSVHDGMLISTIMMGFLMLITHFCGGLSRAFISPDLVPTSDSVVPYVASLTMHPVVCGFFLAACMAAVMSTVAGVLISVTSAAVKDLWLHSKERADPDYLADPANLKKYKTLTTLATVFFTALAVVLAINSPGLISFIGLFAIGGLEGVFLVPLIGGLFWKRGNRTGALIASVLGFAAFLLGKTLLAPVLGEVDASVPAVLISVLGYVIGSYCGKPNLTAQQMEVYFPTV